LTGAEFFRGPGELETIREGVDGVRLKKSEHPKKQSARAEGILFR
jgi:hypothetical protein